MGSFTEEKHKSYSREKGGKTPLFFSKFFFINLKNGITTKN
ncbi:hypothetical protein EU98_0939 [Prochlorococcus marinus str. MIT 9314]|uniref:Uncharacterized protein n=1 Tax=Prochlorococcus marinus str. MIT 9314 TaxID=167548 RepID=A0A0A2AN89_PROMR|nr:hypothetical protein EU98_0939 [Prochlorococcus marinus str. MIT 9314]